MMNKYFLGLMLIASLNLFAKIPAELEKAIQESDLEKVQEIVPTISISQNKKVALLDLAQETIVKRRLDFELSECEYRFGEKRKLAVKPGAGIILGLIFCGFFAITTLHYAMSTNEIEKSFTPYAAGATILMIPFTVLLEFCVRRLYQIRESVKQLYEHAVSIKQLLFAVETNY